MCCSATCAFFRMMYIGEGFPQSFFLICDNKPVNLLESAVCTVRFATTVSVVKQTKLRVDNIKADNAFIPMLFCVCVCVSVCLTCVHLRSRKQSSRTRNSFSSGE